MSKINFFKLTIISSIIFLLVMFLYKGIAYYSYNIYSGDLSTQEFIIKNFSFLMKIEPILKQSLIISTTFLFGCSVSNNILKLSKIKLLNKTILYITTFCILGLLVFLLLVLMTISSIMLYQVTSIMMILLIIIWIGTIITDFIHTKNNNTSIISRILIAVLTVALIIVNTTKVNNDYKVNQSLLNSIEYRIETYEKILVDLDEESKVIVQGYIDGLNNKKLPIYSTSLYAGKSVFVFYGDIEVDLFLSAVEKAQTLEDRINVVKSYLHTEDVYDIYSINYGLYIGGSSSSVISLVLIVLAIITLKLFPLTREEEIVDNELEALLEEKLNSNLITEEEYQLLIRKMGC